MDRRPYENKLDRTIIADCDSCGERLVAARDGRDFVLCRECEIKLAKRRTARRRMELEA